MMSIDACEIGPVVYRNTKPCESLDNPKGFRAWMYVTLWISKAVQGSLKIKNKQCTFIFIHEFHPGADTSADRLTICYEYWNIIWDEPGFPLRRRVSGCLRSRPIYDLAFLHPHADPLTRLNNVCTPHTVCLNYIIGLHAYRRIIVQDLI